MAGKWHLLTGERKKIYDLGRNHYFVEEDLGLEKDPDDFIHTENFILVDTKKRLRGFYDGTSEADMERLADEIEILLDEEFSEE